MEHVNNLIKGFCFLTSLNHISLSSLSAEMTSLIENNTEHFETILTNMEFKSRKKRIRKKFVKLAAQKLKDDIQMGALHDKKAEKQETKSMPVVAKNVAIEPVSVEPVELTAPVAEVAVATPAPTEETLAIDFTQLPVGFMLKIGKRFFKDEQVIRFYYNQNHPEVYKNKELLTAQLKTLVEQADADAKAEILPLLHEQVSK